MVEEGTLFGESRLVPVTFKDWKNNLRRLEHLAQESAEQPLFRGEEDFQHYKAGRGSKRRGMDTRLGTIRHYLGVGPHSGESDASSNQRYLIKLKDQTIGFVSIWDGWH